MGKIRTGRITIGKIIIEMGKNINRENNNGEKYKRENNEDGGKVY